MKKAINPKIGLEVGFTKSTQLAHIILLNVIQGMENSKSPNKMFAFKNGREREIDLRSMAKKSANFQK